MTTLRARVAAIHRASLQLLNAGELLDARLSPALAASPDPLLHPGVGDWVLAESDGSDSPLRVTSLEPRRSALIRRAAGERLAPQLLAANVDTALLFSAFPHDINPRRLARLAALAWEGDATPIVVLSRADLVDDSSIARALLEVGEQLPGVTCLPVSAVTDRGMPALREWLRPGTTLALLGASGAGKSTLVNALAGGDVMATAATRSDGKGRHTTTHRALIALPNDVTVIDTPGLREVGMWTGTAGGEFVFPEITTLAPHCRFGDCTHDAEPGCAVRHAVESGTITAERYEQWRQLQREARRAERSVQEQRRIERLGSRAIKRYDKDHRGERGER